MKGKFITIYGVNNIGKSTQAQILVKRLVESGYPTKYLKYPLYDLAPTGPQLNQLLRNSSHQTISEADLQTLITHNRKAFEPQLIEMLNEGNIVIAEDYSGTGIAWGMAKGLTFEYMEKLNAELIREDLSLLLTGQRSITAREEGHLHEKDDQLLDKVSDILLSLSDKYGWGKIMVQKTKEETSELIWNKISSFLAKP